MLPCAGASSWFALRCGCALQRAPAEMPPRKPEHGRRDQNHCRSGSVPIPSYERHAFGVRPPAPDVDAQQLNHRRNRDANTEVERHPKRRWLREPGAAACRQSHAAVGEFRDDDVTDRRRQTDPGGIPVRRRRYIAKERYLEQLPCEVQEEGEQTDGPPRVARAADRRDARSVGGPWRSAALP